MYSYTILSAFSRSSPRPRSYKIAKPATSPPAIAPTTPGTFTTAAPVCAGAEEEAAADEVLEAEVEKEEDSAALEDMAMDEELMVALRLCESVAMEVGRTAEPDAVIKPETTVEAPETAADEAPGRDAMNVGVTTVVGTASLSVGMGLGTAGTSVG